MNKEGPRTHIIRAAQHVVVFNNKNGFSVTPIVFSHTKFCRLEVISTSMTTSCNMTQDSPSSTHWTTLHGTEGTTQTDILSHSVPLYIAYGHVMMP